MEDTLKYRKWNKVLHYLLNCLIRCEHSYIAFVRTNKNLDLAEKKFNEFKNNKKQQKEKIKIRLDNQYREKAQKYESSLIKMYSKKSATSRKYTQATKKREELIRDYGQIFGNQYQK